MKEIKAPAIKHPGILNISEEIVEKVAIKDDGKTQYYIDSECKIPATSYYVASDGDIVMTAKIGKTTIVTCINNSALEDMSEKTDTRTATSTAERQQRKKTVTISGDSIEICEISLGHYRNKVAKVAGIDEILTGVRRYYDKTTGEQLENDKNGNVNYRTAIICSVANKELAIAKMKEIAENSNIKIDWAAQ